MLAASTALGKFDQNSASFAAKSHLMSGTNITVLNDNSNIQRPVIKHESDDDSCTDSTTNDEWEPISKAVRLPDSAGDYGISSPAYSSAESNGPTAVQRSAKTSNRPTGPRKPRKDVQAIILSLYFVNSYQ